MYEKVMAISLSTTGPDPRKDELLALAAAVYVDGRVAAEFFEPIQPSRPVASHHAAAAGLSVESLEAARDRDSVLADFMAFIADEAPVLLTHRAVSCRAFLRSATQGAFAASLLDTEELVRVCLPFLAAYGLDDVGDYLELPPPAGRGPAAECRQILALWPMLLDLAGDIPASVLTQINLLLADREGCALSDLFRRVATRQTGADSTALMDLFPEQTLPRPRREPPEPVERELLDPDEVTALLGRDGPFAMRVASYEYREEQLTMARSVTDALNGVQHLLVEAGTGIGKTLAYLVPAALWSQRNDVPVIVSTNTKNLQIQLFDRDLPMIRDVLDVDLRVALIKGRRNYLCLRRLFHLLRHANAELGGRERLGMAAVLAWAAGTTTGDLSESPAWGCPGLTTLPALLASLGEECAGSECHCRRRCFLYRARRIALAADVIVANHALVFAEMGLPTSSPALPPYKHIIFDEAHNLEGAATRHFSVELSQLRMRIILNRLWRPRRRGPGRGLVPALLRRLERNVSGNGADAPRAARQAAEAVIGAVAMVEPESDRFFMALSKLLKDDGPRDNCRLRPEHRPPAVWAPIQEARQDLVQSLTDVVQAVKDLLSHLDEAADEEHPEEAPGFGADLNGAVVRLQEFIEAIELILACTKEGYVFWVERVAPSQGCVRAWAAPIHVGEHLAAGLYESKETGIFCSATLTVGRSTDFLKKRLGLDRLAPERLAETCLGTPFDFARQCLVMVPMFLPEPGERERDYAAELGQLLAQVFERTRGRGMGLFTSYDMLRRTTDVLRRESAAAGLDVLAQGESGSREHITDTFRHNPETVLMGTHSFWEGVDVVGESLSCLVVARLPFGVFTDPIIEARCEQIEADGGNAFNGYSLPSAVIRFRQGFGRLIRHRTDRGIVIVADRRILAKRYGAWFCRSLPARTVGFREPVAFLDAVQAFFEAAG